MLNILIQQTSNLNVYGQIDYYKDFEYDIQKVIEDYDKLYVREFYHNNCLIRTVVGFTEVEREFASIAMVNKEELSKFKRSNLFKLYKFFNRM
jgi:hypothetical protein